jgi:hypothetical protein
MRVDLPLPVLPTIPVFRPPGKVTVSPLRTNGSCGAYFTCVKLDVNSVFHPKYDYTLIFFN